MEHTQRLGRHPLILSQYKREGPLIREFRGCGLAEGRKEVYFKVPTEAFFLGKFLARMAFHLKEVSMAGATSCMP